MIKEANASPFECPVPYKNPDPTTLARFAVDEYNKNSNMNEQIQLLRVVNVDHESHLYYLTLDAIDEAGKKKRYQAILYTGDEHNKMRLASFRLLEEWEPDNLYGPIMKTGDPDEWENDMRFPGCDYNHWIVVMDKPGGEGASKEQMIECYIDTLDKVLGSEKKAKKKIYNVSCSMRFSYLGFGCEIDENTANKIEGLPGVRSVLPDSFVDPDNKEYGGELFKNGKIVQRTPKRQARV